MIKISKEVAKRLHNEYGIRYKENGISKTKTKHPKYYLCESKRNLKCLLKIAYSDEADRLLKDIIEREKREKEELERFF